MKKSLKILVAVFAGIGVIAIIAAVSIILMLSRNKNAVTVSGPAMAPTLKADQQVTITPYSTGQAPGRGDIIEFTAKNSSTNTSQNLILRVVGTPGDHIIINEGQVTVSNSQSPNGFNPDSSYLPADTTTSGRTDITLQPGEYFVLGDNRANSLDSRVFGPVLANQILGQVNP